MVGLHEKSIGDLSDHAFMARMLKKYPRQGRSSRPPPVLVAATPSEKSRTNYSILSPFAICYYVANSRLFAIWYLGLRSCAFLRVPAHTPPT